MILHWQTVPEGSQVSREDFDRMKAEELADLARWEALGHDNLNGGLRVIRT